jgi:hypothetical protein
MAAKPPPKNVLKLIADATARLGKKKQVIPEATLMNRIRKRKGGKF